MHTFNLKSNACFLPRKIIAAKSVSLAQANKTVPQGLIQDGCRALSLVVGTQHAPRMKKARTLQNLLPKAELVAPGCVVGSRRVSHQEMNHLGQSRWKKYCHRPGHAKSLPCRTALLGCNRYRCSAVEEDATDETVTV